MPFFPARGKHRIGKAGREGWINYFQRVHNCSRFPPSICSEQLRCSAPVGFRGSPSTSAGGDGPLGYFWGRFGARFLRYRGCPLYLLLLFMSSLQEESREQRGPPPSLLVIWEKRQHRRPPAGSCLQTFIATGVQWTWARHLCSPSLASIQSKS